MAIAGTIQRWRRSRRCHATARQLRKLPPTELRALGIRPAEIDRLACLAARN
jgi:uncharacterized protein YjiS (DUF1127 family)